MKFNFKQHHIIRTKIPVLEVRKLISNTYEARDILKWQAFDKQYKYLPTFLLENFKRYIFINDHSIKYLGEYNALNFQLRSPYIYYWRGVNVFVYQGNQITKIDLEFIDFSLIMIPLSILNIFMLLIIIFFDFNSVIPMMTVVLPLNFYFMIKYLLTFYYFKKKLTSSKLVQ